MQFQLVLHSDVLSDVCLQTLNDFLVNLGAAGSAVRAVGHAVRTIRNRLVVGAVDDSSRHAVFPLVVVFLFLLDLGGSVFVVLVLFASVFEGLDINLFEHVVVIVDQLFAHLSLLQHLVLDVLELQVDNHINA